MFNNDNSNNNNYKPNPDNSSIMQALLDIKAAGGSFTTINDLLMFLENDPNLLKEAELRFHRHQYPQRSITFTKVSNKVEFSRFLSYNALTILTALYQNMWHGNMIQIRRKDIVKITSISSFRPIKDAFEELINKGCIAVAVPGTTRRPTVYMVNPEIATVGRDDSSLRRTFWAYTGTDYSNPKHPVNSDPHKEWKRLTSERTYSKNRTSMETDAGTIT